MWKYIEMACGHTELHLISVDATWLKGRSNESKIRQRVCGHCADGLQHEAMIQGLCEQNPHM